MVSVMCLHCAHYSLVSNAQNKDVIGIETTRVSAKQNRTRALDPRVTFALTVTLSQVHPTNLPGIPV